MRETISRLLIGALLPWIAILVTACGGGDSQVTTIRGPGLNELGMNPPVKLSAEFVQRSNNMKVVVDGGPVSFNRPANILYATVTICEPNGSPQRCVEVPHVQVDTGSVGLRILSSKLASLNLPPVQLTPSSNASVWQCYPFVIGGMWGRNVQADITLGTQIAPNVPMQLIQDDERGLQAPEDCARAAGGQLQPDGTYTRSLILDSSAKLSSNGILGIGATDLDCDSVCVSSTDGGKEQLGFTMYYACADGSIATGSCPGTAIDRPFQVHNPVSKLPLHNNGVVLAMPAVPFPGAASATGELIFGIGTSHLDTNAVPNQLAGNINQVFLGTDPSMDSYLNVTTTYRQQPILNSYLDTGTNGLFFTSNAQTPLPPCVADPTWYCPLDTMVEQAVISDGGLPAANSVTVSFSVFNAEALFSTSNAAFAGLAGSPPTNSGSAFAWGLPFFYGKRVFLSIWQAPYTVGPMYAWESI